MSLFRIINVYNLTMYNKEFQCTYKTNEDYQIELLKIFQIENHEELGSQIELLYTLLDPPRLTPLLDKVMEIYFWANREHAFYLLFSYDYLRYTHPYISNLLNKTEYTSSYEKLLSELK